MTGGKEYREAVATRFVSTLLLCCRDIRRRRRFSGTVRHPLQPPLLCLCCHRFAAAAVALLLPSIRASTVSLCVVCSVAPVSLLQPLLPPSAMNSRQIEGTPQLACSLCDEASFVDGEHGQLVMNCGHAYHRYCLTLLRQKKRSCAADLCGGSLSREADVLHDLSTALVSPDAPLHCHREAILSEESAMSDDEAAFLSEFEDTADLDSETQLIASIDRAALSRKLKKRLPCRSSLPHYITQLSSIPATRRALCYSSLLAFFGTGEVCIVFRDLLTHRAIMAESAFFSQSIGHVPYDRKTALESGVVVMAARGEKRTFGSQLYMSMIGLKMDVKRLHDPDVEIMIVTTDGQREAAGFRLFICRCDHFISNSLLLCETHYLQCQGFNHSHYTYQANMMPLVERIHMPELGSCAESAIVID